jgi:hypothetical protein
MLVVVDCNAQELIIRLWRIEYNSFASLDLVTALDIAVILRVLRCIPGLFSDFISAFSNI